MHARRLPLVGSRVLMSTRFQPCPHCGACTQLVTICEMARFRCDPDAVLESSDGSAQVVTLIHLCPPGPARAKSIRDLVSQIPRG